MILKKPDDFSDRSVFGVKHSNPLMKVNFYYEDEEVGCIIDNFIGFFWWMSKFRRYKHRNDDGRADFSTRPYHVF